MPCDLSALCGDTKFTKIKEASDCVCLKGVGWFMLYFRKMIRDGWGAGWFFSFHQKLHQKSTRLQFWRNKRTVSKSICFLCRNPDWQRRTAIALGQFIFRRFSNITCGLVFPEQLSSIPLDHVGRHIRPDTAIVSRQRKNRLASFEQGAS